MRLFLYNKYILRLLRLFKFVFIFVFRRSKLNFSKNSCDVTLTTYGERIPFSFIPILSLFDGQVKPGRVYLTLDEGQKLSVFSSVILNRLKALGVIVLTGPKVGPHAKYFAYLHQVWDGRTPWVMVDDDVMYDRDLVKILYESYLAYPQCNIAVRCFQFSMKNGRPIPYVEWSKWTKIGVSNLIFATNVGGVLVNPDFSRVLKSYGTKFLEMCPRADDIWFHWVSVRHALPYYCCVDQFMNPPTIPMTQGMALFLTNNEGGNDEQIAKTYEVADYEFLAEL